MTRVLVLLALAAKLQAQSSSMILCDQASPKHCWGMTAPTAATLSPVHTTMWGKSGALLVGLASTDISILPGSVVSSDAFVSVSATSNASVISMAATPSTGGADLSVGKTGTGTLLPLRFWRNPNIVGQWNTSNQFLVGLNSTDVSSGLGSIIAGGTIVSATDVSNASLGSFAAVASNYVAIASSKTGSGTYLPLTLWTSATERLRIETGGRMLFGLTTSDISNTAGSIVAADSIISATAASNASLGSFAAVAGNYVALASGKSGSGTYLPLTFWTSNLERFRIDTSGNLVQGATTRINSTGAGTFSGVTVSTITGSTQCIQVNSSGVLQGTGLSCGGPVAGSTGEVQFNTSGAFDSDPNNFIWEKSNHRLVLGLASSDVGSANGMVVSGNSFVTTTATSNASVGSFGAVASNYVALASGKSGSGTYLPLNFWTSGVERIRIDTGGKVGIGTTAPSALLDIAGTQRIQSATNNASSRPSVGSGLINGEIRGYSASGAGFDDGFLRLRAGGDTNNGQASYMEISGFSTVADMDNTIVFGTRGTERMRLAAYGYLGIGTANPPLARLDIQSPTGGSAFRIVDDDGTTERFLIPQHGDSWTNFNTTWRLTNTFSGGSIVLGTASTDRMVITPAGTALFGLSATGVSTLPGAIVSVDTIASVGAAGNDTSVGSFKTVAGNYVAIASSKVGTASFLPLTFWTNSTERLRIETSGAFLFGLSSTDISVSAGGIISANSLVTTTASSNASVGSFGAIAGNYVALSSGRSGSGTFLPLVMFTNNAERLRIDTAGHVRIQSSTPSISSGTGCSIRSGSNDVRGEIDGCSGSSVTVAFGSSWANAPFCIVTNTLAAAGATATTTGFIATIGGIGSPTLYYHCVE